MNKQDHLEHDVAPIIKLGVICSANDYAQQLVRESNPPEGTIVRAREQTAGKGYGNNYWESKPGANVTLSLILYPTFLEAEKQFYLNKFISLGLLDLLQGKIGNTIFSVKWPNDIYAGDSKIAGILIKNVINGPFIKESIIGIGLNVNQLNFSRELPNPVSMRNLSGITYDLDKTISQIKDFILNRYQQAIEGRFGVIDADYFDHLYRKHGFHLFTKDGHRIEAKIVDINPIGQLILETRDGKAIKANFKEVEFVI